MCVFAFVCVHVHVHICVIPVHMHLVQWVYTMAHMRIFSEWVYTVAYIHCVQAWKELKLLCTNNVFSMV